MGLGMKLFRLKRRLTKASVGLQIPVNFSDKEARFLTEYLEKSLEIAIYNQNQNHAMMLQELINKMYNGYLDSQEPEQHAWLDQEEEEFEEGGEFVL